MTQDTDFKNIIVVGASAAGHNVVNGLAGSLPPSHRILLVERSEFVLHAPTVVRAVVAPGWESKNLTARISQDTIFPAHSRHRVLCPNSVVELRKDTVVLEHPFEGSTEIAFDKCILAMGAQQPAPMRPQIGSSLEEYKAFLRKMQGDIKAASSVLVVGGGAVGVEIAGEINHLYPEKKVTIVHTNPDGLLNPGKKDCKVDCKKDSTPTNPHTYVADPTSPNLSTSLESQLAKRGVDVILGDRVVSGPNNSPLTAGPVGSLSSFSLRSGKTVEADYILLSTGNVPNSSLVRSADPGAVTPTGHIAVDALFRVLPSSDRSVMAGEYYALGDVASVPAWKTLVAIQSEAPALAKIIAAEVKGKKPQPYGVPGAAKNLVVTLGASGGGGQLMVPLWGQVSAPGLVVGMKSGDFFAGRSFFSRFRGAANVN